MCSALLCDTSLLPAEGRIVEVNVGPALEQHLGDGSPGRVESYFLMAVLVLLALGLSTSLGWVIWEMVRTDVPSDGTPASVLEEDEEAVRKGTRHRYILYAALWSAYFTQGCISTLTITESYDLMQELGRGAVSSRKHHGA